MALHRERHDPPKRPVRPYERVISKSGSSMVDADRAVANRMVEAAGVWLDSLDADQRKVAVGPPPGVGGEAEAERCACR